MPDPTMTGPLDSEAQARELPPCSHLRSLQRGM